MTPSQRELNPFTTSTGEPLAAAAARGGGFRPLSIATETAKPTAVPTVTSARTPASPITAKGRVREVSPRADPVTGTFKVRIGLIEPPAGLRLGSTVTGTMRMETPAAIEIPGSALVRAGAQSAVWIVDPKTQTVAQRPIRVAGHDAERVVIAAGLEAGDVIVTAGVQALHAGQKVRPLGAAK